MRIIVTLLVEKLIFLFNFKLCDKCSYILGVTYGVYRHLFMSYDYS